MNRNKSKVIKGSATIVVIFAAITSSIYMVSTFADYEHYKNISDNYENFLQNNYNANDLSLVYSNSLMNIKNNNYIIQSGPKKYMMKNLIMNSNFEEGTNGWIYYRKGLPDNEQPTLEVVNSSAIENKGDKIASGNYSIKVINNSETFLYNQEEVSTVILELEKNIKTDYGHKYYVSGYVWQNFETSGDNLGGMVSIRMGHASKETNDYKTNITSHVAHFYYDIYEYGKEIDNKRWNKISGVYTNKAESNNVTTSDYEYNSLYFWIVTYIDGDKGKYVIPQKNSYFLVDNVLVVDLTQTFGEGNEPDKEWCDTNIEFFNGYKQIMK